MATVIIYSRIATQRKEITCAPVAVSYWIRFAAPYDPDEMRISRCSGVRSLKMIEEGVTNPVRSPAHLGQIRGENTVRIVVVESKGEAILMVAEQMRFVHPRGTCEFG